MSKGSWFYDNLKVGARRVAGGAGMFFHLPVPSLLSGRANEKRATRFIRESFCEKRTILHQTSRTSIASRPGASWSPTTDLVERCAQITHLSRPHLRPARGNLFRDVRNLNALKRHPPSPVPSGDPYCLGPKTHIIPTVNVSCFVAMLLAQLPQVKNGRSDQSRRYSIRVRKRGSSFTGWTSSVNVFSRRFCLNPVDRASVSSMNRREAV